MDCARRETEHRNQQHESGKLSCSIIGLVGKLHVYYCDTCRRLYYSTSTSATNCPHCCKSGMLAGMFSEHVSQLVTRQIIKHLSESVTVTIEKRKE